MVSPINPLRIQAQALRREIPTLLIVSVVLWPILRDLSLSQPEGLPARTSSTLCWSAARPRWSGRLPSAADSRAGSTSGL